MKYITKTKIQEKRAVDKPFLCILVKMTFSYKFAKNMWKYSTFGDKIIFVWIISIIQEKETPAMRRFLSVKGMLGCILLIVRFLIFAF